MRVGGEAPPEWAGNRHAVCEGGSNDEPRPWVLRGSEGVSRGRAEVGPNRLVETGYFYAGVKVGGLTLRERYVSSAPE